MHLLAFDATTPVMSITIKLDSGELISETILEGGTHSVHLLPAIHRLLTQTSLSVKALTGLVVANGPGSFTGLRIALATAKALAHPFDLPIYAVSTLKGLSYHGASFEGYTLPMLDARRQQVYGALYCKEQALWPEDTYTIAELIERLPEVLGDHGQVLLVGDGAIVHGPALQNALGKESVILPEQPLLNDARGLLWAKDLGEAQLCTYETLTANYLRVSQAERERAQGVNHAAPKLL